MKAKPYPKQAGWCRVNSLLLALTLLAAPVSYAANWQVLVLGDVTPDTLPGNHPAWQRADRAITDQLIQQGYAVYDKAALRLLPACTGARCGPPTVAELIELARRTSADIDLVVTYSVTVTERTGAAVRQWQLRLPGRMIDISSGTIVDQWSGTLTEVADVSNTCRDNCLVQWLADRAAMSGAELGAVLATKLAAFVREFAYRLTLEGFTPTERDVVVRTLREAPDYRSRALQQQANTTARQWLHKTVNSTWTIKTPLSSGALRERLEGIGREHDIPITVRYDSGVYRIARDGLPYRGRYLAGLTAPLLLGGGLALWQRQRRQEARAAEYQALCAGAEQALADSQWYRLASLAGQALQKTSDGEEHADQHRRLQEILAQAGTALRPLQGPARGLGALRSWRVLIGDRVPLGRAHGEVAEGIGFNYQRASRLGKQATLLRSRSGFSVIDNGSTHGTLLGETLVSDKRASSLSAGDSVCFGGGREPPRAGAARLQIGIPVPGTALLQLTGFHLKLLDATELAAVWPSLSEDLGKRWLWLGEPVPLVVGPEGLAVGSAVPDAPGLLLGYAEGEAAGYTVAPLGAPDPRVTVDDEVLSCCVPLAATARLAIGEIHFGLEAL